MGPIGGGFGNVVFPGTGIPRDTGHAASLGPTVRGVYPPSFNRGTHNAAPIYPVAVPVFVNPYAGYGYGYGYPAPQQASAPVTVINAPQPSPTVIINQNYAPERANPVMRDYSQEQLPEPASVQSYQAPIPSNPDPPKRSAASDQPTIYLLALKDGTVYSAYAYWLEGDTVHYVTTKHAHNQASLDLVDASVSEQLNRERGVEFKLKR